MGDRFHARRPAGKDADDRFQIAAVLLIEAEHVDPGHGEGRPRDLERHDPSGLAVGIVPHPAKAVVGDSRSIPAAAGDFDGGVLVQVDVQLLPERRTISVSSVRL